MRKKAPQLSKTKAIDFYANLTGLPKGTIAKMIEPFNTANKSFDLRVGQFWYSAWIVDDRIYCQICLTNECIYGAHFDMETFEYDWVFTERQRRRYEAN